MGTHHSCATRAARNGITGYNIVVIRSSLVVLVMVLTLLLSQLAGSPGGETRPKETCELYNASSVVFLGRVLERGEIKAPSPLAVNLPQPAVQAQTIRVAVLERFKGEIESEQTLVPPFPRDSVTKSLVFSPPVEIGGTYLFYARHYYEILNAQAVIPADQAHLDDLRHRRHMTTGSIRGQVDGWEDRQISITALSDNSSFQARTRVFANMGYQFDSLPPGLYTFSLETHGAEFELLARAQIAAGGCATVDLVRSPDLQHLTGPEIDCSWAEQHPSLCEKLQSAGTVLVGRIVKRGDGVSKFPDPDPQYSEKWEDRFSSHPPQPEPQFGYEMHVLPVEVLRGTKKKTEVAYERLNNHPFCGDRVVIGETYLIFAEYLDSQSDLFKPLAFYKMSDSLGRKVQQCKTSGGSH
jgi:hypothetical protein